MGVVAVSNEDIRCFSRVNVQVENRYSNDVKKVSSLLYHLADFLGSYFSPPHTSIKNEHTRRRGEFGRLRRGRRHHRQKKRWQRNQKVRNTLLTVSLPTFLLRCNFIVFSLVCVAAVVPRICHGVFSSINTTQCRHPRHHTIRCNRSNPILSFFFVFRGLFHSFLQKYFGTRRLPNLLRLHLHQKKNLLHDPHPQRIVHGYPCVGV